MRAENLLINLNEILIKGLDIPSTNNLIVYFSYLKKIISYRKKNPTLYDKGGSRLRKVYLVGESHCLSPAFTNVIIDGVRHSCIPRLVIGCQARHISEMVNNEYKESFKRALDDMNSGDTVILIFGEIDTRNNNGIYRYHKKIGDLSSSSLLKTIDEIVNGYVDNIVKYKGTRNLNIKFCGVPLCNSVKLGYSEHEKDDIFFIIKYFNDALKRKSEISGFSFVDVYGLTSDLLERDAEECHIDERHLFPEMLGRALSMG